MTYGAFQTSVARSDLVVNGLLVDPTKADTENFIVETAAGLTPGVVVSRGTLANQVVLGVGTEVLGIVVRSGENFGAVGSEVTNTPVYPQNTVVQILRDGEIYADVTGTGSAGSTAVNATDATGAIDLGAAAAGQTNLLGVKLESTMAAAGVARLRIGRNDFANGTAGS